MATKKQYISWLAELKQTILQVKLQTSLQVNANMLMVYWYIGKQIQQKVSYENWGTKVIGQLALDLQKSFPDTRGFSIRNLNYMRQFAEAYPQEKKQMKPSKSKGLKQKKPIVQSVIAQLEMIDKDVFVQSLIAQITWTHHITLMNKISDTAERMWYMQQTVENAWSVRVLDCQISTDLYHRQAKSKKTTNFHLTLPKEQSDLALQMLKDPYQFDFLQIEKDANERTLETQLTTHIQQFLLELGAGFAYVGRQFKLKIGRKEYFLDLLFYHLHLRCFIVIDLKMGEFEPEFAGKMNAYLNVLNKEHKQMHDHASIGIILCNSKDEVEVEYALQGLQHPIGVSEYKTMHTLPKNLRDKLPSAKQLKDVMKAFNEQHSATNIKPKKKK